MPAPFIARVMRLSLIAAALQLSLAAQPALATEDCTLNGVEVSLSHGSTTAGKSGLVRCVDRETKIIISERELRAGELVGMRRNYTDGVLRLEYGRDERGREHGATRKFAANKQMLSEEFYEHGQRVGMQREWYESGKLSIVEFHAKNDSAKARYTPQGQLTNLKCGSKALLAPHVDDATLCGFKGKPSNLEYFHDDGKARGRETYLAGVSVLYQALDSAGKIHATLERRGKQRIETDFSSEGKKSLETVWDLSEKSSVKQRQAQFHSSGSLVREQQFTMLEFAGARRNLLSLEASYFLNGQPKRRETYSIVGNDRYKTLETFHDNGKPALKGRYIEVREDQFRPDGTIQTFAADGLLVQEQIYDDKGNVKRERTFNEQGKLEKDEELFEDGSRKAFAK